MDADTLWCTIPAAEVRALGPVVQMPIATPAPKLRRATSGDAPELARMLTRAFLDDPLAVWSCRAEALRPAVLERFQAARLRQLLCDGEVWTTP